MYGIALRLTPTLALPLEGRGNGFLFPLPGGRSGWGFGGSHKPYNPGAIS